MIDAGTLESTEMAGADTSGATDSWARRVMKRGAADHEVQRTNGLDISLGAG